MKGIKVILGVLAAASILFSVNANAQENNNRTKNGKVVRGAYETNKAFDNTFIGIGVGINSVIFDITKADWGNTGLAADLYFGKWWTPAIGMRLGYHGIWNTPKNAFDIQNPTAGQDVNAQPWQVPSYKGDYKYGFHYIHADMLWNISNSIGGYKETRFWDFIPYLSMGVLDVSNEVAFKGNNLEYAAGAGLINELRLFNRLNVIIDLNVLVGKSSAYTTNAGGRFLFFPSATVGLQFNLGKTNFDRHSTITPVVIPVPFTMDQYNSLAARAEALEKENAALRDKAAAMENELAGYRNNLVDGQTYLYENGTFTAVDVKPGTPLTLYFDCGATKLSKREQAHLEYFTANVVDENTKLSVNAYADKQTGSAKRNQYLSEQRAKYVVDLLKKAGAKEENIESAAHGASIQLFDGTEKNRVVTIEVK